MAQQNRIRGWLIGALVAAGLVTAVLNMGELEHFGRLARQAEPLWLLAGVALQLGTYFCVAAGWALVLKVGGAPRPLSMLAPIAVAKLFTDQVVPSAGVSGNALLVDRLIESGVPRGQAASALLISIIGYYAGFAAIALGALAILWARSRATPLLAATFVLFMAVASAIPLGALRLVRHKPKSLPRPLRRIPFLRSLLETVAEVPEGPFGDAGLLARVAAFNALVFVADAATLLAMLHAVGQPTGLAPPLVALVVASIVVTLGPIPLGLGSFEASCIFMLRMLGVPLEPAVAATLLLRGLTLWLPLVPGLLLARHYARRPRREARAGALVEVP